MGLTKSWLIKMTDESYREIPSEMRMQFISEKAVFDDYNEYKDDPVFKKLYKAKKAATKALDKYRFDKRHN